MGLREEGRRGKVGTAGELVNKGRKMDEDWLSVYGCEV